MIIEDATGQAEIHTCSRVPDVWSTNEGRNLTDILHIPAAGFSPNSMTCYCLRF